VRYGCFHGGDERCEPRRAVLEVFMVDKWIGRTAMLVATGLALSGGGCMIASDVINPAFLTGLGFDPQTVVPPQGRVVVTFQNATDFNASFASAFSRFPYGDDAVIEFMIAENVGPDEERNSVLDCPVAVISPAPDIDQFGEVGVGVAAIVATAEGVVEVAYNGSPLLNNSDFVCGDVVVIRLLQTGAAGGENDFRFQVERLPGR
jgi:hypothetical protein